MLSQNWLEPDNGTLLGHNPRMSQGSMNKQSFLRWENAKLHDKNVKKMKKKNHMIFKQNRQNTLYACK